MPRKPYNNPDVESAVRDLEREFQDAFTQMERYLQDELASLNRDGQILVKDTFNIERINKAILPELKARARELGFGNVIDVQINNLSDLTKEILNESGSMGLPKSLTKTTGENIKALLQNAQSTILSDENLVSQELESILRRSATGNVKYDDLIGNIKDRLGIRQDQAITKSADVIQSFHTQARVEHFTDAGVEWFLYDGPRDERNRPFCAHFVGKRVTTKLLDSHAMDFERKHPLPPSVSLGGYNCRHELVPLVDEDVDKYQEAKQSDNKGVTTRSRFEAT